MSYIVVDMITRQEMIVYAKEICTTSGEQVIAGAIIDKIYHSIIPKEKEDKKDPWAWVKEEYVAMFKAKNPSKGKFAREAKTRIKAMLIEYPEMRKEDVILTTKLYLSQTDSRFIRFPHYFIKKGSGKDAIYEFLSWYDKYKESKEAGLGRTSVTNTMQ